MRRNSGLGRLVAWSAFFALSVAIPCLASDAERDLLSDASDIDKTIATGGLLYGNLELDAYVQSVADRLTQPEDARTIRVRVLKGPWPNAFVLPNGSSYVTTAMLEMVQNEAQLACVIGHEMTHLTGQHALQEFRAQKTRLAWSSVLAVVVGAAGAYYGGGQVGSLLANLTADAGELWTLSAVSGYSQDHEREADRQGFARLVAAGYDGAQAPVVFELLLAQTPDAAGQPRPYFASHPKLEERIASMRALAAAATPADAGHVDADRYLSAVGELPLEQAFMLIEAGQPAEAQRSVERFLSRNPENARAHYAAGEAWRSLGCGPTCADRAIDEYSRAAALPGTPPDALRKKGLLHRERGEMPAAREAFERFLALDPTAIDAGLIRVYVRELDEPPR
jgi:predicted Zn-dependent protease